MALGEPWAIGLRFSCENALTSHALSDLLVQSPKLAFTDNDIHKSLSCNIYEAEPDNVLKALPQAVMAAVVQAQRFGYCRISFIETGTECCRRFKTFRGCITTGEEWLFFVYNRNTSGSGGVVSWLSQIRLESDLRGLTLVLGLLRDWVGFIANHIRVSYSLISNGRSRMGRYTKWSSAHMLVPPMPQASNLFSIFCEALCASQT